MSTASGETGPDPRPGLQAERTTLAWQRTGLGVAGVAALLAHAGLTVGWAAALVLAVVLLVAAEERHRRFAAGLSEGDVPPAHAMALGLTLGVLALTALGIVTVLRG